MLVQSNADAPLAYGLYVFMQSASGRGPGAALGVMEAHLKDRTYFVGERYSIADIALYAYTHVAEEGGFDLGAYLAVRSWLARVAAEPGHVLIDA